MMIDNFENGIIEKTENCTTNGAKSRQLAQMRKMKNIDVEATGSWV